MAMDAMNIDFMTDCETPYGEAAKTCLMLDGRLRHKVKVLPGNAMQRANLIAKMTNDKFVKLMVQALQKPNKPKMEQDLRIMLNMAPNAKLEGIAKVIREAIAIAEAKTTGGNLNIDASHVLGKNRQELQDLLKIINTITDSKAHALNGATGFGKAAKGPRTVNFPTH